MKNLSQALKCAIPKTFNYVLCASLMLAVVLSSSFSWSKPKALKGELLRVERKANITYYYFRFATSDGYVNVAGRGDGTIFRFDGTRSGQILYASGSASGMWSVQNGSYYLTVSYAFGPNDGESYSGPATESGQQFPLD
ncbi:hypothetical protein GCM10027037_02730 [Mucilaginibacter koreensis]